MKKIHDKGISKYTVLAIISLGIFFTGCSKESKDDSQPVSEQAANTATAIPALPVDDGKGVGPIKTVSLGPVNQKLVADGKKVFEAKCTACHNLENKKVGPALKGVTLRRKPEWIMNMILNPGEMTQKDPTAKKLYSELLVQMANQNAGQDGARAILEYFRENDTKKGK